MTQRKNDHISMAASSVPQKAAIDNRFYYEPMLNVHSEVPLRINFLGKEVQHPLWISSMTGGSSEANRINHLLAEAAAFYGLGMGLGSCRTLLSSDKYFDDFNLRPIIGDELPFYANLGIAQVEQLLQKNELDRIHCFVDKLNADGLFVHINPIQEFIQPEGDLFKRPAIETINLLLDRVGGRYKILVKEVGQGMGPESVSELFKTNIDGFEFGASGGTNFANIEIMRNQKEYASHLYPLVNIGHSVDEMIDFTNNLYDLTANKALQLIVSGGIPNFLDGYYYTQRSKFPSLYGMAGKVLEYALKSRDDLFNFLKAEIEGYKFACAFLSVKKT